MTKLEGTTGKAERTEKRKDPAHPKEGERGLSSEKLVSVVQMLNGVIRFFLGESLDSGG